MYIERWRNAKKYNYKLFSQEVKIEQIINIFIRIDIDINRKFDKQSERFIDIQQNINRSWRETIILLQKKFRILQYNVYKSRNKIIVALLQEKSIKDYNILIIQEL